LTSGAAPHQGVELLFATSGTNGHGRRRFRRNA
jgi:hypothetical protein